MVGNVSGGHASASERLFVGILVSLCSSTLSNLGLIVMKSIVTTNSATVVINSTPPMSPGFSPTSSGVSEPPIVRFHSQSSFIDDVKQTRETSVYILSKANLKWALGLLCFILGQLLNLVSLSFLEQMVWAVLSLFSLVANAFFASIILHEKLTFRDLWCTALIVLGSSLVVVANTNALQQAESAAGGSKVVWTIPALIEHFSRPWFLVYCFMLFMILTVTIIHGVRSLGQGYHVHALTWTIFSSACGSVSVLLGKCLVEMVTIVVNTGQGYHSPQAIRLFGSVSTYAIFAVFVIAALGAVVSLNMALAVGDALVVVPWLTVTNTLLAILGGIFYFEEFSTFETFKSATLFISGCTLAILGSASLRPGQVHSESQEGVISSQILVHSVDSQDNVAEKEQIHLLAAVNSSGLAYNT